MTVAITPYTSQPTITAAAADAAPVKQKRLQPSPIKALHTLAQAPLTRSCLTQTIAQTRRLDAFSTDEQQVGLAIALKSIDTVNTRDTNIDQQQRQTLMAMDLTSAETQALLSALKKADSILTREPLLDQQQRPGLVLTINSSDPSQHRQGQDDIPPLLALLQAKGIRPTLYTGHQSAASLAQLAHQQLGDTQAVTLTFDNPAPITTQGFSQINVIINSTPQTLGRFIQTQGFDQLLEKTSQPSAAVSATPIPNLLPIVTSEYAQAHFQPLKTRALTQTSDLRISTGGELNHLPLIDLFHCDPLRLVDEIGRSDEPRQLALWELATITDSPGAEGMRADHQALLLHYVGQFYKAVNQGAAAIDGFWDTLFSATELSQTLGLDRAQALGEQAKEHFSRVDLQQLKPLLALEIRRQAQAYAVEDRITTILHKAYTPATSRAVFSQQLALGQEELMALAEEALTLYKQTGYLRLLTGTRGAVRHATALTLEKVDTDKGEENLAIYFNTGDHPLRGVLKAPAREGQEAKYHAHPQAYVGVTLEAEHLVNLVKGMYSFNTELTDIIHAKRFETLTSNDITSNLANQHGVRRVNMDDLARDQGQKEGSCTMKSAQAPIKYKLPFLLSLVKVMRLADALKNVAELRREMEPPIPAAEREALQTIQINGQRQLATHTEKMLAMLRANQVLSHNQIIAKGRVPLDVPSSIQVLAQRAGDLIGNPFQALPYQRNNLEQITLLQQLTQARHDSGGNTSGIKSMLSTLASLKEQAEHSHVYLNETRFSAATPQYHRDIKNHHQALANKLIVNCQQRPVALLINLENQPTLMLLERPATSAHFQLTVLTPNLSHAHQSLRAPSTASQSDNTGFIRFELKPEILLPSEDNNTFYDLIFTASAANNYSWLEDVGADAFNPTFDFALLGPAVQNWHSEILHTALPRTAPTGMLLMELLSQQQLGKGSEDYRQVFSPYLQEIQREAAAAAAEVEPTQGADSRYAHLLALAEQLK